MGSDAMTAHNRSGHYFVIYIYLFALSSFIMCMIRPPSQNPEEFEMMNEGIFWGNVALLVLGFITAACQFLNWCLVKQLN